MLEKHGKHRFPNEAKAGADGMVSLMRCFLEWLEIRGYSKATVTMRGKYLYYFWTWCEQRDITRAQDVTKTVLERYQRYVYHHLKKNGEALSVRSQFNQLAPVRTFFRWLTKNNHLLSNPAANLTMPRLEKKLPRSILTVEEVNEVLNATNVNEPLGIRDRAILETLYATGIRRRELIQLKIEDVDVKEGKLNINLGKGNKDRVLPLGERAVLWISKYLREVRDSLLKEVDDRALFLSKEGKEFHPNTLSFLVLKYVKTSKIGKAGSCHMFRHTMATQMLEGGADIRFIQQMLGHSSLKSTEIYTQVSLRQLREVFMETHPAARLKRQKDS